MPKKIINYTMEQLSHWQTNQKAQSTISYKMGKIKKQKKNEYALNFLLKLLMLALDSVHCLQKL